MDPKIIIGLIIAYFAILVVISYLTSKEDNAKTFFVGNRDTPWYVIAFGMIGTSISGVTFISVPGAVGKGHFSYLMVVFGYVVGYLVIINVLLPLYYRLNLTSIYQYLSQRFGAVTYKTGASFFLVSRLLGSSLRLCVAAVVLYNLVFLPLGISFEISVVASVALIYVYTFQSGVKTVIWTDTAQTVGLLLGLFISIYIIMNKLDWSIGQTVQEVWRSEYSQIVFTDVNKSNFFLKSFIGGAAITLAMTGLDQDMMQKNLACRSLADAQKNMYWFSFILVIVNICFLALGALLYLYSTKVGLLEMGEKLTFHLSPEKSQIIRPDDLFPLLANNYLGGAAAITFILGVIAATYSSADSAMTALTSSFCIDILNFEQRTDEDAKRKTRYLVHIMFAFLAIIVILFFYHLNDDTLISKVLDIAGYTYGPLVGLYAFGVFTKYAIKDKYSPIICLTSAILSYFLKNGIPTGAEKPFLLFGEYKIGLEILLINGLMTFIGLWLIREKGKVASEVQALNQ